MKYENVRHCITLDYLRCIRDAHPTENELLEWLGPGNHGWYYTLRKVHLLVIHDGIVRLSPEFTSNDGRRVQWGHQMFYLEDRIDTFVMALDGNPQS